LTSDSPTTRHIEGKRATRLGIGVGGVYTAARDAHRGSDGLEACASQACQRRQDPSLRPRYRVPKAEPSTLEDGVDGAAQFAF